MRARDTIERLAGRAIRRLRFLDGPPARGDDLDWKEQAFINQGRVLARLNASRRSDDFSDYEFKVFSQWGEDGLLQHILSEIGEIDRSFIEFGVEDFWESNCRFLMMKDNWRGFVVDGSPTNIDAIRSAYYFWRFDLEATCRFVTVENVGRTLDESGFSKECGLLSVDIDGVDYHVLAALAPWRPGVIVVEYNAIFGPQRAVTVPYSPDFSRFQAHFSGLYWGASLGAFCRLLGGRGYGLVGVNSVGTNAFFVREDLIRGNLRARNASDVYRAAVCRDARDEAGRPLFLKPNERSQVIAHLEILDLETGGLVQVGSL